MKKNFITPKTGSSKNFADGIPKPSRPASRTYDLKGAKFYNTGNQPSQLTVAAKSSKTKNNPSTY